MFESSENSLVMSGKNIKSMGLLFLVWSFFLAQVKTNDFQSNAKKISFSCTGRPAGYYADIDSGCQVYHMCDGLGRQFTYSCPNTTLFQQRMLICDHWYMVNCSISERDYAVNFLIGQRNKPFVNDEDTNYRTPRPDILNPNFLADYNSHFFNPPKKQTSAAHNQIDNNHTQKQQKNSNSRQHWKIMTPSQTILPPSAHTLKEPQKAKPIIRTMITSVLQNSQKVQFISEKHLDNSDMDDLGTSHSTRYNTSADFESNESTNKSLLQINNKFISSRSSVTVPSRIYQPPFLYPIYNENDTAPIKKPTLTTSTASPFRVRIGSNSKTLSNTTTTTVTPLSNPTTLRGKPFTVHKPNPKPLENILFKFPNNKSITSEDHDANKITPAQGFLPSFKVNSQPLVQTLMVPHKTLQPPQHELIIHDVASTQGPPIYYEWKDLVNILQPPKLDPPYGVDGREYPESFPDFSDKNSVSSPSSLNVITSGFEHKLLDTKTQKESRQSSVRSTKSITEEATKSSNSKTQSQLISAQSPLSKDVNELRKMFAVPEFIFPLENLARTGYAAEGSFNSFQLKIPKHSADATVPKNDPWYGENPKCPQCHPSFVKPGTCDPCIKR